MNKERAQQLMDELQSIRVELDDLYRERIYGDHASFPFDLITVSKARDAVAEARVQMSVFASLYADPVNLIGADLEEVA